MGAVAVLALLCMGVIMALSVAGVASVDKTALPTILMLTAVSAAVSARNFKRMHSDNG